MAHPTKICLTPVRNEGWIIREFLKAARFWADRIIVLDQVSTDGTREILRADPQVDLLCNDDATFDERTRQLTLIERARNTVPGAKILLALDGDEFLSANCRESAEWKKVAEAAPGTVLRFKWVNVLPGFTHAWIPENRIACGFVDDGSRHRPKQIHSTRIPMPEGAPVIDLEEVVILHLQHISEERMLSKHRWYQAWEHVNDPARSEMDIFRQYNHRLGSWKTGELQPVRPEWLEGFKAEGIDLAGIHSERVTWWDRELLDMMDRHGAAFFRRIALWDRDWGRVAQELGRNPAPYRDPRSGTGKAIHSFLAKSQGRRGTVAVRVAEKLLRWGGW